MAVDETFRKITLHFVHVTSLFCIYSTADTQTRVTRNHMLITHTYAHRETRQLSKEVDHTAEVTDDGQS